MLLFHSDRLVSLASVLYWPFFVLCNYALGRELGLASRGAWLIAWLIASVPSVLFFKSDGLVDVPMHSFLACALVFALRGLRLSRYGALLPWLGIACGLVGSCKLTGLPVAAILMASPVLMLRPGIPLSLLARRTLLGLLLCLLCVLPWCLYDVAATGFPLSPFSISVAGLQLGQTPPDMTWYLGMPVPSLHPRWVQEIIALRQVFISNFPGRVDPFILPLLVLAPVGWWRLWKREWRLALLLGILTLCFAGFYASGSFTSIRLTHASINGRFFLAALAYLAMLGYPTLRRLGPKVDLCLAIVILFELGAFAFYDWSPDSLATFPACAGALLLLSIALYRLAGASRRASMALTLLAVLPAWILGSFALHDALRAGFLHQRWDWKAAYAPAYTAVDDPGHPHRIALTSGPYQKGEEMQPLLLTGRDLQNDVTYVPISRSGALVPDSDAQRLAEADYDAWQGRLRSGHVDYVMSFIPDSAELDWMRSHPEAFEKIAGAEGDPEGTWGLYRVRPAVNK